MENLDGLIGLAKLIEWALETERYGIARYWTEILLEELRELEVQQRLNEAVTLLNEAVDEDEYPKELPVS